MSHKYGWGSDATTHDPHRRSAREPIFVYLDETCETVQIDFEGVPVLGLTGRNDGGVTVGH